VVAGAREQETNEVIALGRDLLGDRVRFLTDLDREKVAALYQAADLFALASLHEMMPIAMLEALASGLPIACNDTPTLQWMAGPAGRLSDISREGALAAQLEQIAAPRTREALSLAARTHAERTFSEPVVVRQMMEMYGCVMEQER
jgi:glycosyltransferase involved in cell wall biosynthesis